MHPSFQSLAFRERLYEFSTIPFGGTLDVVTARLVTDFRVVGPYGSASTVTRRRLVHGIVVDNCKLQPSAFDCFPNDNAQAWFAHGDRSSSVCDSAYTRAICAVGAWRIFAHTLTHTHTYTHARTYTSARVHIMPLNLAIRFILQHTVDSYCAVQKYTGGVALSVLTLPETGLCFDGGIGVRARYARSF